MSKISEGFTGPQLAARAAAIPVVTFPDLPVSAHRDEIADMIRNHQVVIIAGETGSGKTTQIPKICLQLGRGVAGMIGHTQPRRIAARSVADRIADELGQRVGKAPGQVVGYQVRFTDEVGPTTLIKLMTDGILLAEIQSDPLLKRYDTLIIDEAHERSLNIDFLLGYIARLLPQRPDLKVIITSATIDSARFASHFGVWDGPVGSGRLISPAPVIEVSGRTFPVEVRYRPLCEDVAKSYSSSVMHDSIVGDKTTGNSAKEALASEQDSPLRFQQLMLEDPDDDLVAQGYGLGEEIDVETAICHAVDELCGEGDGDILIFLPGERDIRDVEQTLRDHLKDRALPPEKSRKPSGNYRGDAVEILPLFARLSAAEQHRIFTPCGYRRIILATNVAETSLTVPGIRYVIDPGFARISRYSNRTKVQRLPIEAVSQASANQRAGRCGRVADGIAIRLYSIADYENRPAYTEPEILRTSLASVILQMAALGLGRVTDFPFLDAPDSRAVRDGINLLTEIGAISGDADNPKLTATGHTLARLPIDPRLGRMLLEGHANGCASEVMVIVAALSIQDVRERPLEFKDAADAAHARYADPKSDFLTYVNLWRYLHIQSRDLSGSAFRRMCRSEFFHYLRFREWRDVVSQLRQMAMPLGIKTEPITLPSARDVIEAAESGGIADAAVRAAVAFGDSHRAVDAGALHRSLLVGLLSNIGQWDEAKRDFAGTRGTHFTIWPGSGLSRSRPAWVMAAELVETSRLFARTVAKIDPAWIEPLAGHLVKRTYSEPHWSVAKGAAIVKEKVLLYGLTLSADRPVLLGRLGDRPLGTVSGELAAFDPSNLQALTGADSPFGDMSCRALAREMFIRHALVEGNWRERHAFQRHNSELLDSAREVERRSRMHGLVADESALEAFFDDVIPTHIVSAAHFNKWWKNERRNRPELLNYTMDVVLPRGTGMDADQFPDSWSTNGMDLTLSYQFLPGSTRDGVTMTIPLEVLPRVTDAGTDWLVPGMLAELATESIRALPKAKRRLLAPAPEVGGQIVEFATAYLRGEESSGSVSSSTSSSRSVGSSTEGNTVTGGASTEAPAVDPLSLDAALGRLAAWGAKTGMATQAKRSSHSTPSTPTKDATTASATTDDHRADNTTAETSATSTDRARAKRLARTKENTPFTQVFSHAVRQLRGVDLDQTDLEYMQEHLPPYLRMTFVVTDRSGREVGSGSDLAYLQKTLGQKSDAAIASAVRAAVEDAQRAAKSRRRGKNTNPSRSSSPHCDTHSATNGVTLTSAHTATNPDAHSRDTDKAGGTSTPSKHGVMEANGLTTFPATPLPQSVDEETNGMRLRGFPTLVAQGDTTEPKAGVRIVGSPAVAERSHRLGLSHLLLRTLRLATKRITTRWTGRQALMLAATSYGDTESLVAAAQLASVISLVDELCAEHGTSAIRSVKDFDRLATTMRDLHEDRVYAILGHVVRAMEAHAETQEALSTYTSNSVTYVARDVRRVTKELVGGDFLLSIPYAQLPHVARYVRAGGVRLQRVATSSASVLARDEDTMDTIEVIDERLSQERASVATRPFDPVRAQELDDAYWMLHELRVSLFAQQLGTPVKVSAKRILGILDQGRSQ